MRGALFAAALLALVGLAGAGMHGVLASEEDGLPLARRATLALVAADGQAPAIAAQAVEGVVAPAVPEGAAAAGFGPHLDSAEIVQVLALAGWPEELWAQAARVIAGPTRNCPTGESNGQVAAGGGHAYKGIFQLSAPLWFTYAGEDWTQWADPVVNARTAWRVYQYDIAHGNPPWTQWTCKP